MTRLSQMFDSHMIQQRAIESTTRKREREKEWRDRALSTRLKIKKSEYEIESRKDWRVKDKMRILATKINKSRLAGRNYSFISEGKMEEVIISRMAKDNSSALDAIKVLTEELV